MENVEENIPEHLKCPICISLPKGHVFQCRDGHVICANCYKSVSICPQCRVAFTSEGIRCRMMENMLENLKMDCPFKESGCEKMLTRQVVEQHIKSCPHGRPAINVCSLIGYGDCSFLVREHDTPASIQHFHQMHGLRMEKSPVLQLKYCNFADVAKASVGLRQNTNSNNTFICKPILVTNSTEDLAVLLLTMWSKVDQTVSWIPIGIGCLSSAKVSLCIFDEGCSVNESSVSWGILARVIEVMKVEQVLSDVYGIRTPVALLAENCAADGSLSVHCRLEMGSTNTIALDRTPIIRIIPEMGNPNQEGSSLSIAGKYALTSSENYREYLLTRNGRLPKNFDENAAARVEVSESENGHYTIKAINVWSTTEVSFPLGEEITDDGFTHTRRKDGNKLIHTHQFINWKGECKEHTFIREFYEHQMIQEISVDGVTSTRVFRRL